MRAGAEGQTRPPRERRLFLSSDPHAVLRAPEAHSGGTMAVTSSAAADGEGWCTEAPCIDSDTNPNSEQGEVRRAVRYRIYAQLRRKPPSVRLEAPKKLSIYVHWPYCSKVLLVPHRRLLNY